MRTTIDLPDALLKHLKARAALEGRTLRDLVVDLVEKGLNTREAVDPQQRMQARPLIGGGHAWLGRCFGQPSAAGADQPGRR